MQNSKHNIIYPIQGTDKYYILNLLSSNVDIVSEEVAKSLEAENSEYHDSLFEKGYLINPSEEKKQFNSSYFDFVEQRDNEEIQLFFVPWYSCNFSCSYCYQDEYSQPSKPIDHQIIDSFFDYILKKFENNRKYITLFGGEPLLIGEVYKKAIEYFIEKSIEHRISICVVTNGFHLSQYIDILKSAQIREIQITLDGTSGIHNQRRQLKGGLPTFEQVVNGIDQCLANEIPVNLRFVIDKENIDNLPELAEFAISKGWTKSPYFKSQIGRNYELHHCNSSPEKLFSRLSLNEELFKLVNEHPIVLELHKPNFSIVKYLHENGELPQPLFDSCPACKTEWAFDYTGSIYSCTATVGKKGEELGTFYPQVWVNDELVNQWAERDVTTIPACKDCNQQLACGGGCASVAKNKTGSILAPDCRPIKETVGLGIATYFKEELK